LLKIRVRLIINEDVIAQRLYPIVSTNARVAKTDTVLPIGGGRDGQSPILIPAGQSVYFHIYAMHRDQKYWGPDALTFRPERWENLKAPWRYVPFGGGPRICPGRACYPCLHYP
jgi:cytochrome P450